MSGLRDLLWLDVETTGLRADHHEIVSVAWCQTSPDGREVRGNGERLAFAEALHRADPAALAVNGYDHEAWRRAGAIRQGELAADLTLLFRAGPLRLAGHGVAFDAGFLAALFDAHGHGVHLGHQHLDVRSMAYPLLLAGEVEGIGLAHLAQWIGREQSAVHTAAQDVDLTRAVFLRLVERFEAAYLKQRGLAAPEAADGKG